MTEKFPSSNKPIDFLIGELIAALYLRPRMDDAEDRHELGKEIIRRFQGRKHSLNPLVQELKHDGWAVRHERADILGWIGNSDAVQALRKVMQDDESNAVRRSAALVLERIGTPEAVEAVKCYRK